MAVLSCGVRLILRKRRKALPNNFFVTCKPRPLWARAGADERSATTNYVSRLYLLNKQLSLSAGHPKQGRAGTPARGSSGVAFEVVSFERVLGGKQRLHIRLLPASTE